MTTRALLFPVLASLVSVLAAQTPPCVESSIGTDLQLGDDQVSSALSLGFSFPFAGRSTSIVTVSSNGFLWLGSNTDDGCCNGDLTSFLASTARIAVAWTDLDPSSSGSVHFATFAGRAVITWDNVVEYGGSSPISAQAQLMADGSIILSWQFPLSIDSHTTLVGVTPGGSTGTSRSVNFNGGLPFDSGTSATVYEVFSSGSIDVGGNVVLLTPNGQGGYSITRRNDCRFASFTRIGTGCPISLPVTLFASAASRPAIGTNFDMIVGEAPTAPSAGAMIYGTQVNGTSLSPIGMTGCALYSAAAFTQPFVVQGRYSVVTLPIPATSSLVGAFFFNQAALVAPGANPLGVVASNGGRIEIGT
ncbi:MAG: hypothetical protein R3F56_01705 [Planctomycetota bacterium]